MYLSCRADGPCSGFIWDGMVFLSAVMDPTVYMILGVFRGLFCLVFAMLDCCNSYVGVGVCMSKVEAPSEKRERRFMDYSTDVSCITFYYLNQGFVYHNLYLFQATKLVQKK